MSPLDDVIMDRDNLRSVFHLHVVLIMIVLQHAEHVCKNITMINMSNKCLKDKTEVTVPTVLFDLRKVRIYVT